MKDLNRWMVGLDFTVTDDTLIDYVAYLADCFRPSSIHFVHLFTPVEIPDEMKRYLPEGELPTVESIQKKLEKKVTTRFSEADTICEVYENKSSFHLWQQAEQQNIDLFLAGSKSLEEGRGILAQKFVRKSRCSVCFVPAKTLRKLQKIMVPIDFSSNAAQALRMAATVAQQEQDSQILCLHVFELPHAYYYDNFPREQYIELVEKRAKREYQVFKEEVNIQDVSVKPIFKLREYSYVAEHIQREAESRRADLILMSAGGKSAFSRILLGSEAERMVQMEKKIPVLILKKSE